MQNISPDGISRHGSEVGAFPLDLGLFGTDGEGSGARLGAGDRAMRFVRARKIERALWTKP